MAADDGPSGGHAERRSNSTSLKKCRLSVRRLAATYPAVTNIGQLARYPKWRSTTAAVAKVTDAWPEGKAQHSPVGRSRRTVTLIAPVNAMVIRFARNRSKPRCDTLFVRVPATGSIA